MKLLFFPDFQRSRSIVHPKILFTAFILIIFTTAAKAQLGSVKFELFKDKVYFNVTFKGHESDTLRFLFDTGAEAGVLDSITAVKLFGKGQFERSEVVDAGGVSYRRSLKKQTVFVGGVTVKNVDLVIQDLQPLYRGKPFYGIIGYNLLKAFVIQVDFSNSQVNIFKTVGDVHANLGFPVQVNWRHAIPTLFCNLVAPDGSIYSGQYLIDSGAGLTMLLSTAYVAKNSLIEKLGNNTSSSSQGLNNRLINYNGTAQVFGFDRFGFSNVPVRMSKQTSGATSDEKNAGILGAEILYRFNLIFDHQHQTIFFSPNQLYFKTF